MDSFERYVLIPLGAVLVVGLLIVALGLVTLTIASLAVRLFA